MSYIEIAFIFTAAMLVMVLVRILSIMLPGSNVTLPIIIPFTNINPGNALIFYPSMLFQIWFWTEKLGVFL